MQKLEATKKELQWMHHCILSAQTFKRCLKRQFYCVIIDKYGAQIGSGFNGLPAGMTNCTDGGCPRAFSDVQKGSSYDDCGSCHAEENALLHSDYTLYREGATLIVSGNPCWRCAKLICGSGIRRVVYLHEDGWVDWEKCEKFFMDANVELIGIREDSLPSLLRGNEARL